MLRKMLTFLLAAAMLLSCACAEEPENPFIGTWDVLYYIIDGVPQEAEELGYTDTFVIEESSITVWVGETSYTFSEYTYDSTSFACDGNTFVLQGDDMMICRTDDLTCLAARVDPTVLNNPFIGTWNALCVVEDGEVSRPPEDSASITLTFTPDAVTCQDEYAAQTVSCTYKDGVCTIGEAMDSGYCVIGEDGLMRIYAESLNSDYYAILSNVEEVVPDYISRYLGEWATLATSSPEGLPDPQPTVIFTRAYVFTPMDDIAILCSYTEDACTWHIADDVTATCTIDANGLMTITNEQATLWLVRANPDPTAE